MTQLIRPGFLLGPHGGVGIPGFPKSRVRLGVLADSRGADMLYGTTGFRNSSPGSLIGAGVTYQPADINAVSGETTAQILARAAATASRPNLDAVLIFAGNNDIATGVALATIKANITALVAGVVASGRVAILATETTRSTSTAPMIADTLALNAWEKTTLASSFFGKLIVADIASVLMNGSGVLNTGMFRDGIHVGPEGVRVSEIVFQAAMRSLTNGSTNLAALASDPTSFAPNPFFTGTGGTMGYGITGVLPDGCSTYTTITLTSGTIVGSVATRLDGFGNDAVLTFTNAVAATSDGFSEVGFGINIARPGGILDGDKVEAVFEARVGPNPVGFNTPVGQLYNSGANTTVSQSSDAPAGTQLANTVEEVFYVRTPALTFSAGQTLLNGLLYANVRLLGVGATGYIKFGRYATRRVT